MFVKQVVLLFIITTKITCFEQFVTPDISIEAYRPKGFRVSIPALPGIQMFAFHGNINKNITPIEPGDYRQEYNSPEGIFWTYFNPELSLQIGDVVNFWIFIQYKKLGYRRESRQWTVTELQKLTDDTCVISETLVGGKTTICKNDVIFEDNFTGRQINVNKWLVEEYIPTYASNSMDFEFVSYQKKQCFLNRNTLFIKPHVLEKDSDVNGELDLRNRCTRKNDEDECYRKADTFLIVPPVVSGRMVSKFKFRYGKVEIRAKLPAGDWIYPQVYLQEVSNLKQKLWISYARGNNHLTLQNQEDIGGRLLFGGPVINLEEPARSQFLKSKRGKKPFSDNMHTYSVVWTKDQISLLIDGTQYGAIDKNTLDQISFSKDDMVQIVLGVGVGGHNDFPDNVLSENRTKPWANKAPKEVKLFYNAKDSWIKTWLGDNTALQVEFVKVYSL